MTSDESKEIEAALAATGNGSSKIAEALGQLLKPVNRALDELFGRVEALEGGQDALLQHLDQRFDQHNAIVLTRLDALEAGRTQNHESIQQAVAEMHKMEQSVRLLETTFKGSADHRRETNEQNVEAARAAAEKSAAAVAKVDALTAKVESLEQVEQDRAKVEKEAKELAARRHAETMAATKDMRNSVNVMQAIFPGVIIWLIEGGPNASMTGFLEAFGVAALMIGWNFVPAFVRWLRLKFGH